MLLFNLSTASSAPVPIYSILLDLPFEAAHRTTPIDNKPLQGKKNICPISPVSSYLQPHLPRSVPPPRHPTARSPRRRIPLPRLRPHQSRHLANNMSNPTGIARTAPIAIASRKPPPQSSLDNNTDGRDSLIRNILSASTESTASTESGSNTRTRKDRPCDACRRRKSRCVIHEGQSSCVLCQLHNQECTFVQSPQPRKRKLNAEGKEESLAKRRYAE